MINSTKSATCFQLSGFKSNHSKPSDQDPRRIPDVLAIDVSAKIWRRTFRQKNMPKRLRLKTFAETFRMICGAYPVYARSPSPSQRPAPTTIASRSPFPPGLCSCSTSLSKMGIYAAPMGRGALDEMRTYPRHAICFISFLH